MAHKNDRDAHIEESKDVQKLYNDGLTDISQNQLIENQSASLLHEVDKLDIKLAQHKSHESLTKSAEPIIDEETEPD